MKTFLICEEQTHRLLKCFCCVCGQVVAFALEVSGEQCSRDGSHLNEDGWVPRGLPKNTPTYMVLFSPMPSCPGLEDIIIMLSYLFTEIG